METGNAAIVNRFIAEAKNGGRLELIDTLVSHDFVDHVAPPGLPAGREGLKRMFLALRAAFPDLTVSVEDQISERDRVVTRQTYRGTHRGAWLGIRPTGRAVSWELIDIIRIADGQIAEHWAVADLAGLMRQIEP